MSSCNLPELCQGDPESPILDPRWTGQEFQVRPFSGGSDWRAKDDTTGLGDDFELGCLGVGSGGETRSLGGEEGPGGGDSVSSPSGNAQIVTVPLVQEVNVRDRIIEVPEVHITQKIRQKVIVKDIIRKVPKQEIHYVEKFVEVPEIRVVDKFVSKPVTKYEADPVPKATQSYS